MAKQETSEPSIQTSFEAILARYETMRKMLPFGTSAPVWADFTHIGTEINKVFRPKWGTRLNVKWSMGQGNWASVPWIAALDGRETDRPSRGVFVIYLFRADMSGVYLTLNQGTGGMTGPSYFSRLSDRAEKIAARTGKALEKHGFTLCTDGRIELRSDTPRVRPYEHSTVAFKLYERGKVPNDTRLLTDLSNMLTVYEGIVPSDLGRS